MTRDRQEARCKPEKVDITREKCYTVSSEICECPGNSALTLRDATTPQGGAACQVYPESAPNVAIIFLVIKRGKQSTVLPNVQVQNFTTMWRGSRFPVIHGVRLANCESVRICLNAGLMSIGRCLHPVHAILSRLWGRRFFVLRSKPRWSGLVEGATNQSFPAAKLADAIMLPLYFGMGALTTIRLFSDHKPSGRAEDAQSTDCVGKRAQGPYGGESVTIELPIPPSACHSNSRVHWTERATANSAMRQWACYRARAANDRQPRWHRATITVQAHYDDHRRRDNDGLLASLKSAIDGIVDAGILHDDDQITYVVLPAMRDRAKGLAGVRITIEPVKGDE